MVAVVAAQAVFLAYLYMSNLNLGNELSSLSSSYSVLEENHAELQSEYNSLNSTCASLQENFNNLDDEHQNLESAHSNLLLEHDSLESDYANLNTEYSTLQSQHEAYVQAYLQIRQQVNFHTEHPTTNDTKFITPSDPEVMRIMLQETGGWSDQTDWSEYWDDIKKLYDWVEGNIEYAEDPSSPYLFSNPSLGVFFKGENWQFPNETLRIMQGDCEDQAILLASLIRAYNSQKYAVYCIVITNHAALFFPVEEDKICILDPAMHYTTSYGWPTYYLRSEDFRQGVNDWLNWVGGVKQVEWMFSDILYTTFSGTEDFFSFWEA